MPGPVPCPTAGTAGTVDDASDIDYWCRSMYEAVSPSHAAWCAQIGYNSFSQNAMNKNITRLEDPNTTYQPKDYVLRYDTNMDSYMRRPLVGIDSFTSVTVTFRYWALTGNSTTSLGNDYVWVSVTSFGRRHAQQWRPDRDLEAARLELLRLENGDPVHTDRLDLDKLQLPLGGRGSGGRSVHRGVPGRHRGGGHR